MEQTNDTHVIYFTDLFFTVLRAWRKILVFALIFAVLLGGVQTVRVWKSRNDQQASPSKATLAEIADLEAKQAFTQSQIASLKDYMDNSVLMNVNPFRVYQATANIYVEAETPETTLAVICAYQSFLRSYVHSSGIAQTLGINENYLTELVSCQVVEDAENMLTITVSYLDDVGAEQFLSVLLSGAKDATTEITQNVSPHTIRIISYPTMQRTSQTLQKQQNDFKATLNTLKTDLDTTQAKLAELTTTVTDNPANPILVAVIGACVGAAVVICFALVRHFVTDKVYSARTLKNRTGIKVLACMPVPGKHSKIDRWLAKLENRAYHPEQAEIAAAAVVHYCRDAKHLLILGNYDPAAIAVFQKACTPNGITITDGKNVLYSVVGANALADCDAVLLLETCNRSLCTDIDKTMEIIADHNKQLLGCVLLGG